MSVGMPTSYKNPRACDSYRFEEFEVRVHTDTLLRNGERVRIQERPFRLLLILLENPGTVLSNEELGRRLGGAEWYVELGSLRVAVTKLREALRDDASAPRFIRTVSGQGYKFIAPVTPVFEMPSAAVPPEAPAEVPAVEEPKSSRGRGAGAASRLTSELASSLISRTAWRAALIALPVVFVLGLAAYLLYWRSSRPIASERDMIVVGGFTNLTSDHALDGTLSSAFLVKMQESPYLNLLMDRKFRELIRNPEEATLNDELNACRALRGKVLLGGQLTGPGPDHRVVLLAWECRGGHLLIEEKAEARTETEILPALNRAAEQMRKRLGEPDSSLQRFNVPLAQATTSSLAALRAFTQGEEKRLQGLEFESIRDFRFAIDLDPQFALVYARLGTIYCNAGEYALSRQNYQRAFELRGRTTDHERLYITANYYMCATGETERAIEAYEFWRKIYPRDIAPVNNLAIQYLMIGQPKKAVELARIGIQMDPNMNLLYGTWSQAYLQTGNYEALNAFCRGAQGQGNSVAVLHVNCFQGAFAQKDEQGMARELNWAQGKPQEGQLLQEAAIAALYQGKAAEGWRLFTEAKESALRQNMPEFAAGASLNMAGFEADLGLPRQARDEAQDGLKLAPNSPMLMGFAALALARDGDIRAARDIAEKAAAQEPQNTILNSAVLASTRGAIQLQRHDAKAAIASMEEMRPYDFNYFMLLAPAYYRGLAYLEGGQFQQAAAEFQRVLDHRTLFPASPYLLLAELERGRALQLSGNAAGAAASYRELDDIWKNADADFPPFHELHGYERQLAAHK